MKKSILFVELIYLHYVISECSGDPPVVPEGAFSDWDNSTKVAGTLVTYTCLTGKQVKAVCEAASMTWKPTSIVCQHNRRGGEVKKVKKEQIGKKGRKGKKGKRGKKKTGKKPARKPGKKPGRGKTESCRCGKKITSRIVNGQNAMEFDWPWIVRLKIGEYEFYNEGPKAGPYDPSLANYNPSRCGGSLIADQWILTAAHCYWGETITVLLGDHDAWYNYEYSTDQNEKNITVDKVIVHAYWYSKYGLHDIALLKLSEKVDMTKYTPVCLPDAESTYVGKMADIYGWGHTSYQGERAYILQEASVEVRENQVCIDKPYLMTKWQLCAFTNGTDTCQGDSGGPMTIYDNGQHKQIGIVSYGDGCGTYPGVYTRVSEYVDWIKAQIGANGGAEYCSM